MNIEYALKLTRKIAKNSTLMPFSDIQKKAIFESFIESDFYITYDDFGKEVQTHVSSRGFNLIKQEKVIFYSTRSTMIEGTYFNELTWDNSKTLCGCEVTSKFKYVDFYIKQEAGRTKVSYWRTDFLEFDDNYNILDCIYPELIGANIFQGKRYTLNEAVLMYIKLKEQE